MRNGTLLAEDSPAELLKLYHCNTLEEVFLLLSRKQGRNIQDVVADQNDADVPPQPQVQIDNRRPNLVSLLISLIYKNYIFLGRSEFRRPNKMP
jgi:hypothetical protein